MSFDPRIIPIEFDPSCTRLLTAPVTSITIPPNHSCWLQSSGNWYNFNIPCNADGWTDVPQPLMNMFQLTLRPLLIHPEKPLCSLLVYVNGDLITGDKLYTNSTAFPIKIGVQILANDVRGMMWTNRIGDFKLRAAYTLDNSSFESYHDNSSFKSYQRIDARTYVDSAEDSRVLLNAEVIEVLPCTLVRKFRLDPSCPQGTRIIFYNSTRFSAAIDDVDLAIPAASCVLLVKFDSAWHII